MSFDPGALAGPLLRQYRAGLAMLSGAVEDCPDELWNDDGYTNAFWQIAYHALFFTHYYLQPHADDFASWEGHRPAPQRIGHGHALGRVPGRSPRRVVHASLAP